MTIADFKARKWRSVMTSEVVATQATNGNDGVFESFLLFEGGNNGKPTPIQVKQIEVERVAQLFVHPFPIGGHLGTSKEFCRSVKSAYLDLCECIDQGGNYEIWRVRVIVPHSG